MGIRTFRSIEEHLRPATTALLLWDMQVGIAGRALKLGELRESIDRLISVGRSKGVPIIWTRHVAPPPEYMTDPAVRSLLRQQGVHSLDHARPQMLENSDDVAFLDGLVPSQDDLVITKSTPSLFIGTPAELRLRALGTRTLAITGVATEHGIEFTARHAMALGYFPVVVEDAVSSFSTSGHELGLDFLRQACDVLPASEVIRTWEDPESAA